MKILALESSVTSGTVAALEDQHCLRELELPPGQQTARLLVPCIRDLLDEVGWSARELDLVAATTGPGSFTGLRLGVTTAKTLAYAAGAEMLGLNTLEVIAAASPAEVRQVTVVVDAQRQQLYAGKLARSGDDWEWQSPTEIVDIKGWLKGLEPAEHVSGPGLKKVRAQLPPQVEVLPEACWQPQAATVGALAGRKFQQGERQDVWGLVPHYFRKPAAEEKWEQRRASQNS